MDLRFMSAMPNADSLRFSDHERILARPSASMLAVFRHRVRRDLCHPRSEALQGERWLMRHQSALPHDASTIQRGKIRMQCHYRRSGETG